MITPGTAFVKNVRQKWFRRTRAIVNTADVADHHASVCLNHRPRATACEVAGVIIPSELLGGGRHWPVATRAGPRAPFGFALPNRNLVAQARLVVP